MKRLQSLYQNRIKLGFSGYSQLCFLSFVFCYPSYSYAGPGAYTIAGGSGSINQSNLTTTINQTSALMAID